MFIPHTIERSTLLAYGVINNEGQLLDNEPDDEGTEEQPREGRRRRRRHGAGGAVRGQCVASLAQLCTRTLPVQLLPALPCSARNYMMETLPTTIPLPLATKVIPDGIYWKLRCNDRWSGEPNNVQEADGDWKRFYLEKHTQQFVERLPPQAYAEEELQELCEMASDFIQRLHMRQLEVLPRYLDPDMDEDDLTEPSDRVNLRPLLAKLNNLVELHIRFSVRNVGSNYRKILFQFTLQDCRNLGDGVSESKKLRLLRVYNSWLDDAKLVALLSHMQDNKTLEALEFPHCHIGDEGAVALAKFLGERPRLRKLNLTNNRIKKIGIQALSCVLTQQSGCGLTDMNISLNNIADDGAQYLMSAALRQATSLRVLNISCAGLGEDSGILLGQVLMRNRCLVDLNVSNNALGPNGGAAIADGMRSNATLQFCDLRMTAITDEQQAIVEKLLHENRCRDRPIPASAINQS